MSSSHPTFGWLLFAVFCCAAAASLSWAQEPIAAPTAAGISATSPSDLLPESHDPILRREDPVLTQEIQVPSAEELPGTIPLDAVENPIGTELTEDDLDSLRPYLFGYNPTQGTTSWLVGGGDKFGMFSLESLPTLPQERTSGMVTGINIHFLSGPIQTDLPPRLFDFQVGWQKREWLSDSFGYDIAARIGAFSDFEGSAREGVRFPSHAVGFYRLDPQVDFVFGVDYLDRDDIPLLPVAGIILTPRDDLRLELVFPRPRIELRISPKRSLYLAGELGGGTWAIERVNNASDVFTYRELRLLFGLATVGEDGHEASLEIGYVFDREISYRSGLGDYSPGSAVLIRMVNRY